MGSNPTPSASVMCRDIGAQTRRSGYTELPLVTLGSDLGGARALLQKYPDGWTAREAVAWLLAGVPAVGG